MYKFLVFAAFLAIAQAQVATNVQRCRFNAGELPLVTRVEGCTEPPCELPQLESAAIQIAFVAPRRLDNIRTLVTAYLNFGSLLIPVPYDMGPAANACDFLTNTRCPVEQDSVVNYTLRVMIEPIFPIGTTVTVEFRIIDENPLICLSVPVRVAAPRGIASDDLNEETVNVIDQLPTDV